MNPIRWLIILLSLACATAWAQGKQIVEADRIVALVNDEVITQVDLNGRLVQVERQLTQQKTPLPDRGIFFPGRWKTEGEAEIFNTLLAPLFHHGPRWLNAERNARSPSVPPSSGS